MIDEFVERFMANKAHIEAKFKKAFPSTYTDLVKTVVEAISNNQLDSKRIHVIDDGDYKGTLVFVIAATGHEPNDYWYVKISYGSCSTCDTLKDIRGYSNGNPTNAQVKDYMMLALHVVQGLKKMGAD